MKRPVIHTVNVIQVVLGGRTQDGGAVYWLESLCCDWKVAGLIPAEVYVSISTQVPSLVLVQDIEPLPARSFYISGREYPMKMYKCHSRAKKEPSCAQLHIRKMLLLCYFTAWKQWHRSAPGLAKPERRTILIYLCVLDTSPLRKPRWVSPRES